MNESQIIIEMARDLYTTRAAYKKEQEQSELYRRWWREQEDEKVKLSKIMTKEIKELKAVIDQAGAEKTIMDKNRKK